MTHNNFIFGIVTLSLITCAMTAATVNGAQGPAVAADPDGPQFIMVHTDRDNDYSDEECIYGNIRYYDNQPHQYINYRIDSIHSAHPIEPDIAMNSDSVIVVWTSSDSDQEGITGRIFDPNLTALTNEFAINSTVAGKQCQPAVAINDNGRSIVVWKSGSVPSRSVSGRLFDTAGAPVTTEFTVASGGDNFAPSVAVDASGLITVAWSIRPGALNYNVAYRQYNPDGSPKTPVILVDEALANIPATSIDMNINGEFVIAWDAHSSDPNQSDIYAQIFDPNNTPKENPFLVNTFTTGIQENPSVSFSGSGKYVIVWQSENADGNDYGICGRSYDLNGPQETEEFAINLYIYGKQHKPDVAINYNDLFFSAWQHEYEIKYQLGQKPGSGSYLSCGDISGNGFVGLNDFVFLAQGWLDWGKNIKYWDYADRYPDGHIDMTDFSFVAKDWMGCCEETWPAEYMEYYYQSVLNDCSSRLRRIGTMMVMYSNDYYDEYPPNLEILVEENYVNSPWPDEVFMCPEVCPHTEYIDYVYRGNDLDVTVPAYMIVIYDKQYNHTGGVRNVIFNHGHVETMTEVDFQTAIVQDNAYRASHPDLQEKPAE